MVSVARLSCRLLRMRMPLNCVFVSRPRVFFYATVLCMRYFYKRDLLGEREVRRVGCFCQKEKRIYLVIKKGLLFTNRARFFSQIGVSTSARVKFVTAVRGVV